MTKTKTRLYSILIVALFFSWISFVSADLEITEVMYDPEGTDTNREWIKLYNNGNEDITIISGKTKSAWRFSDGENGETKHYINDTLVISSGSYAILASDKTTFLDEYSSYSNDDVADTSMSLNNTSGIVKVWDSSGSIVASFEYSIDDSTHEENSSSNDDSDSTSSSSTSSETKSKDKIEPLKITARIISPKTVVVGTPFILNSSITTNRNKTYNVGKLVWNFGDGMTQEFSNTNPFGYYYEYPGEYLMTLSYFETSFSQIPEAIDKLTIKVIPSEIYISGVGNTADPFIEIENKSNSEIDLSNWVITAGTHYFTIPNGTIILSKKKIKLSPKITGFVSENLKSIIITNPNNEIIVTYPTNSYKTTKKILPVSSIKNNSNSNNDLQDNLIEDRQVINLNNLEASASGSGISISKSSYPLAGLILLIGLGVTIFLISRKKDDNINDVEEEISARDMTIIE